MVKRKSRIHTPKALGRLPSVHIFTKKAFAILLGGVIFIVITVFQIGSDDVADITAIDATHSNKSSPQEFHENDSLQSKSTNPKNFHLSDEDRQYIYSLVEHLNTSDLEASAVLLKQLLEKRFKNEVDSVIPALMVDYNIQEDLNQAQKTFSAKIKQAEKIPAIIQDAKASSLNITQISGQSSDINVSVQIAFNPFKSYLADHRKFKPPRRNAKKLVIDTTKFIVPKLVKKEIVPNYTWKEVNDNTTRHFIQFSKPNEHISVFTPLCIDPDTLQLIVLAGDRMCSGSGKDTSYYENFCEYVEDLAYHDFGFDPPRRETFEWIEKHKGKENLIWIEGNTILQHYDKSCGDEKNFLPKIAALHHVLSNSEIYKMEEVNNVFLLMQKEVLKRFLFPENFDFVHKTILSAITFPSILHFGSLYRYFHHNSTQDEVSKIYLLKSLAASAPHTPNAQVACFKRAVIPGSFRERYFVSDSEFPLVSGFSGATDDSPQITLDSLRFRKNMNLGLFQKDSLFPLALRVIYIEDNEWIRAKEKTKVISILSKNALSRNYTFEVLSFQNEPFRSQYERVQDVAMSVFHSGTPRTNIIFMPAFAVTIEIFQYKMAGARMKSDCNNGLRYSSFSPSTGKDFKFSIPKYKNLYFCITHNKDCRKHYMEQMLEFSETDLNQLETLVVDGFNYLNNLRRL